MVHVKFYISAHILSFKTEIQFLDIVISNYYQLSKQADLISDTRSKLSLILALGLKLTKSSATKEI
jgi:hypothetical protein